MPGKKQEKERKRKEAAAMCQDITRYTKKAKQVGVVGDDSLTGPVVVGRLDETTASTTDDSTSVSLSGSVFEVPAIRSLLLMVGKLSIALFCFLYHIAIREMRQGHCCPVKRMHVYDSSAHPPPPPVIPIITTSIDY